MKYSPKSALIRSCLQQQFTDKVDSEEKEQLMKEVATRIKERSAASKKVVDSEDLFAVKNSAKNTILAQLRN